MRGVGNVLTLGVVALVALAGCSPGADEPVEEARGAIQGGAPDVRDAAVVGVVIADAEGHPRRACTGTLIAPNLVLTAQHCVASTAKSVDCARSVFGAPALPELVRITTSPSMWDRGVTWMRVDAVVVPPGPSSVCGRDVALVVLQSPLSALVSPLAPRLDDGVREDEPYAAVGYGASDGDGGDSGLRRRRDRLRVLCVGDACDTRQVDDGEWRGDHGVCDGDSGGPALDGTGAVIGVTSRGPAGCERPIYGALAPHAGWLRAEARVAATMGGYGEPAWVSPPDAGDVHEAGADAHGSCCASPSPSRDAWWSALAVAGLAAGWRRRRSACFRRGWQ